LGDDYEVVSQASASEGAIGSHPTAQGLGRWQGDQLNRSLTPSLSILVHFVHNRAAKRYSRK
jgi:hypothetical protein